MAKATATFDDAGFVRKIQDAVVGKVKEKLALHGLTDVNVSAVGIEGTKIRLEFSGEENDVKKAKEIIGE